MVMAPAAIATTTTTEYAPWTLDREFIKLTFEDVDPVPAHNAVQDACDIVKTAMKQRVESVDPDLCSAGDEDAFFVANMGHVYRQHMRWKKNLKRVKPHYGMFHPVARRGASC